MFCTVDVMSNCCMCGDQTKQNSNGVTRLYLTSINQEIIEAAHPTPTEKKTLCDSLVYLDNICRVTVYCFFNMHHG